MSNHAGWLSSGLLRNRNFSENVANPRHFPDADFRGLIPEMCVADRKQLGYG